MFAGLGLSPGLFEIRRAIWAAAVLVLCAVVVNWAAPARADEKITYPLVPAVLGVDHACKKCQQIKANSHLGGLSGTVEVASGCTNNSCVFSTLPSCSEKLRAIKLQPDERKF